MNNFLTFALLVIVLLCAIGCSSPRKMTGFNHESAYETMVRINQNQSTEWPERSKNHQNHGEVVIEHYDENGNYTGYSVEN